MEGGALFNSGFLGGNFLWWVGQVAPDETWRENIKSEKFDNPQDVKGWGYRYKVRIIGLHDQGEESIPSDQLPWAQVMYPITAGGGQGGSFQTPGIKQGNFVFGFFLDGQDQQVPVIMGVLGNNTQTSLSLTNSSRGGKNFTPQSGYAGYEETRRVADSNLSSQQPKQGDAPTKETPTATSQSAASDKKKGDKLKQKHPLSCPDEQENSDMKRVQTALKALTERIQKIQKSISEWVHAASLPIKERLLEAQEKISKAMNEATELIGSAMKGIMTRVQNFVTDQYNKTLKPLLKQAPGSFGIDLIKLKIQGLEKIACQFNAIYNGLKDLIGGLLGNSQKNKSNRSKSKPKRSANSYRNATTQASNLLPDARIINPNDDLLNQGADDGQESILGDAVEDILEQLEVEPIVDPGFTIPVPICSAEELVAGVLGAHINDIMTVFDEAVRPVVDLVIDSVDEADSSEVAAVKSAVNNLTTVNRFAYTITQQNVINAKNSGDLTRSVSSILADKGFGMKSEDATQATSYFLSNNWYGGLAVSGALSVARNLPRNPGVIKYSNSLAATGGDADETFINMTAINLLSRNISESDVDSSVDALRSVLPIARAQRAARVAAAEATAATTQGGVSQTTPPIPSVYTLALNMLSSGVLSSTTDAGAITGNVTGLDPDTAALASSSSILLSNIYSNTPVSTRGIISALPSEIQSNSLVSAAASIAGGNFADGFKALSGSFGLNSRIAGEVGDVFGAINSGDDGILTYLTGILSRSYPPVLNSVLKNGTQFDFANPAAVQDLAKLVGLKFDIGGALGFISSINEFFACDPKPKCSPNDSHTLQEGGSGTPGKEKPNLLNAAQKAYEESLLSATGGGSFLTGAGTEQESRKYSVPSDVA